jgi:hypothetical protein
MLMPIQVVADEGIAVRFDRLDAILSVAREIK